MSSRVNRTKAWIALTGLATAAILAMPACGGDAKPKESADQGRPGSLSQGLQGNIGNAAIEIDVGAGGANLYDDAIAGIDWVASSTGAVTTSLDNCIPPTGVASCAVPGVTMAAGGLGAWNGLRIVDSIGAADQSVFLTGGKENDTSTWNIGGGNVGGPKFELTQAYLANNPTNLYFGMERSGNNGTTAFDFEFNQRPPSDCSTNPLIPCRTAGDILFTFEMQGAGNSGSATPHVFRWTVPDAGTGFYDELSPVPSGIVTSINLVATTDGAPWGHVDDKGAWVLGDMEKFTFAEATAPLSVLPGVDSCGGKAYVQVRTRSAATENSDLKDATKVFEFLFGNPSATVTVTGGCAGTFDYALATATRPDGSSFLGSATCSWTFKNAAGTTVGTSSSCSGTFSSGVGAFTADVTVTEGDASACSTTASGSATVRVAPTIDIAPDAASASCPGITSDAITYTASVTGGDGVNSISWILPTGVSCTNANPTTTCTIGNQGFCASIPIKATVGASGGCAAATSEEETYTKQTSVSSTNLP